MSPLSMKTFKFDEGTCHKLDESRKVALGALKLDAMWIAVTKAPQELVLQLQRELVQLHPSHHSGAIVDKQLLRQTPGDKCVWGEMGGRGTSMCRERLEGEGQVCVGRDGREGDKCVWGEETRGVAFEHKVICRGEKVLHYMGNGEGIYTKDDGDTSLELKYADTRAQTYTQTAYLTITVSAVVSVVHLTSSE